MTLKDYLNNCEEGTEVTVFDTVYDIESYFYADTSNDERAMIMNDLAQLLTVAEIVKHGVIVNLSDIIEQNIDRIAEAELFNNCDIAWIMTDIEPILSGNVSEDWLRKFVDCLN